VTDIKDLTSNLSKFTRLIVDTDDCRDRLLHILKIMVQIEDELDFESGLSAVLQDMCVDVRWDMCAGFVRIGLTAYDSCGDGYNIYEPATIPFGYLGMNDENIRQEYTEVILDQKHLVIQREITLLEQDAECHWIHTCKEGGFIWQL